MIIVENITTGWSEKTKFCACTRSAFVQKKIVGSLLNCGKLTRPPEREISFKLSKEKSGVPNHAFINDKINIDNKVIINVFAITEISFGHFLKNETIRGGVIMKSIRKIKRENKISGTKLYEPSGNIKIFLRWNIFAKIFTRGSITGEYIVAYKKCFGAIITAGIKILTVTQEMIEMDNIFLE